MTNNLLKFSKGTGHARRQAFRLGLSVCIGTGLLACGLVLGGTRAEAAPPSQRVDFRGLANQRRPGGPSAKVQDLLGGEDLQGHDIPLAADITVYSLDALPKEEPMGQVKAGVTVHAGEEVAPTLVRVKFATSSGHEYEGAAKFADLVPLTTELTVHLSLQAQSTIGESADSRHRNGLVLRSVPESFLAGSSMVHNAAKLRILKTDGTLQEIKTHIGRSIATGPVPHNAGMPDSSYSLHATLKLEGANPGDEYLCYVLHKTNGVTQASQPFGLLCGEGGPHGRCAECYELAPPEKVQAMLERTVAARKAKSKADRKPEADGKRLVILAHPTPIYSPAALPQEKVMGTLPAGTKVLALGETGGGFVRVKFVTPGGRGLEGAAKASDLGEEPENGF